jgi:hypothetical protein
MNVQELRLFCPPAPAHAKELAANTAPAWFLPAKPRFKDARIGGFARPAAAAA